MGANGNLDSSSWLSENFERKAPEMMTNAWLLFESLSRHEETYSNFDGWVLNAELKLLFWHLTEGADGTSLQIYATERSSAGAKRKTKISFHKATKSFSLSTRVDSIDCINVHYCKRLLFDLIKFHYLMDCVA